ncbi:hypothetical protein [Legionella gresilensis]|uniref:hypothetical protein n=1 Tax=Legionella gresilensis TaxID=91823 RepID=UPI0010416E07|nr:hypothetical protein [Legionella gresilensis]
MKTSFRCVVTGRKLDGTSFIEKDHNVSKSPLGIYDFWATEEMPPLSQAKNSLLNQPTTLDLPKMEQFSVFLKFHR